MDRLNTASGKTETLDDKDSYHIYICCRTRDGCNALPAKNTFLYPTAIAKPTYSGNPVYRIMAVD